MRSPAALTIGIAISVQTGWAQKPVTPPSGGPSVPGSHFPTPPNGPQTGSLASTMNGGIYLAGNVMLDDGTPPPDPVTIERICGGGMPRAQTYTDNKGRFSFQIGQTAGVMQDASEGGTGLPGASRTNGGIPGGNSQQTQVPDGPYTQLATCDLRAVLSGFRSDSVSLGVRRLMDDPNVGTIVLHRLANVEGSAISMTSLQAPKEARRYYERALQDLHKEKLAEAGRELQKALEIYPKYAAAWYELGRIQTNAQDFEAARKSFENAVAADAKFVSPYVALAELQAKAESWTDLADSTARLLTLDAVDYPMAYFYSATANLNLGHLDAAEISARAGQKLDTPHRYPKLEQVLAAILERKKDYAGAAAELRSYLLLAPDADDAARIEKELRELDRLAGAHDQAKAAAAQP
ncbi:MAG TPA: tetratricopeptide repeat protein [Bryobacteraceae bacterium]|nr:tetratricopeptide repeat protein [Bryobacteraceae bacterium]